MKKSKSKYINMGCRLNIYEGEVIKSLVENQNISDITIINSCNVTEQAEKKVAYQIRKAKKDNPKNKIILTGCAAQINPQKYFNDKNVDYIFGNREKLQKETWLDLLNSKKLKVKDIFSEYSFNTNIVEKFEGKSRAYIEIQHGCDHRCTFCIIPLKDSSNFFKYSLLPSLIVNQVGLSNSDNKP